jgi:hypothetical protein
MQDSSRSRGPRNSYSSGSRESSNRSAGDESTWDKYTMQGRETAAKSGPVPLPKKGTGWTPSGPIKLMRKESNTSAKAEGTSRKPVIQILQRPTSNTALGTGQPSFPAQSDINNARGASPSPETTEGNPTASSKSALPTTRGVEVAEALPTVLHPERSSRPEPQRLSLAKIAEATVLKKNRNVAKLVDKHMEFQFTEALRQVPTDGGPFWVVAAWGPPGVGKSLLLNLFNNMHLHGAPALPSFPTASTDGALHFRPSTLGLNLCRTRENMLLIDCPALLSTQWMEALDQFAGPVKSNSHGGGGGNSNSSSHRGLRGSGSSHSGGNGNSGKKVQGNHASSAEQRWSDLEEKSLFHQVVCHLYTSIMSNRLLLVVPGASAAPMEILSFCVALLFLRQELGDLKDVHLAPLSIVVACNQVVAPTANSTVPTTIRQCFEPLRAAGIVADVQVISIPILKKNDGRNGVNNLVRALLQPMVPIDTTSGEVWLRKSEVLFRQLKSDVRLKKFTRDWIQAH